MEKNVVIGTKAVFRSWLESKKMTYTQYTKLTPEKKSCIQKEYSNRGKKSDVTVSA